MTVIYALADAATGEVRYIGKAKDARKRLMSHMRDSLRRDTPVYRWIRKHGVPDLVVLVEDCEDWKADEVRMISEYRAAGARLLNVACGGDEPYCPPEVRAENGRRATIARTSTPEKARLYALKRELGQILATGKVSDRVKSKIHAAALRNPAKFGCFLRHVRDVPPLPYRENADNA